jgi:bifunctional DNA-binding transcriptional regulator/antitoxin component of YhaV-PrlF toxin-antitoxin module
MTTEIEDVKHFVRSVTKGKDGSTYICIPWLIAKDLGIKPQNYLEIAQKDDTIVMKRLTLE